MHKAIAEVGKAIFTRALARLVAPAVGRSSATLQAYVHAVLPLNEGNRKASSDARENRGCWGRRRLLWRGYLIELAGA